MDTKSQGLRTSSPYRQTPFDGLALSQLDLLWSEVGLLHEKFYKNGPPQPNTEP